MRARLAELSSALDRAGAILKRAETSGMEVSQALSELSAGQESLVKARVDLHAFDPALVDAAAQKGLQVAEAGYRAGERALADRDFRRKGLALSLATIGVTMVGLWLAVRELDRRRDRPA